jgi:hypothetical protein
MSIGSSLVKKRGQRFRWPRQSMQIIGKLDRDPRQ